jgi:hypothetical protein
MPSKSQKTVTIRLELWNQCDKVYNDDLDYWNSLGVNSSTGLISHYVSEGLSGERVNPAEPYQKILFELQQQRQLLHKILNKP